MNKSVAHPQSLQSRPAGRFIFGCAALLVFTAFFCIEHDLRRSLQDEFGTTADVLEAGTSGSRWSQIGFALFAVTGLICLAHPSDRRLRVDTGIAAAVLLLMAWCALSTLWSIDRDMTIRRLGILVFSFIGALGLVRQFSPRQLCWLTWMLLLAYVGIGLAAELGLGTFRPWRGGYRFAGTMHPNAQGGNCALLCLTSVLLLLRERKWRLLLGAVLLAALALLLLTRSRTSCVALLAALGIIYAVRASFSTRLVTVLTTGWVVCVAVLMMVLLQVASTEQVTGAVLLGREKNVENLNGRTELWAELARYVAVRPWHGYGFRAFWTAENISTISADQYWGISSAHSVYLEVILSVGLIGLGLAALAGIGTFLRLFRTCRLAPDAGVSFLLAIFVYSLVEGVMESGIMIPSMLSIVAGCGFLYTGFVRGGLRAVVGGRSDARRPLQPAVDHGSVSILS